MKNKILHIVAFDIPYPPDYGGAIDVFYKIKSLAEAGTEIILHCFEYGRKHTEILENICHKVFYYPRNMGISGVSFTKPYIVASRCDPALLANLVAVDAPILFEGVHTTYYLNHPTLQSRFKAIRIHNVEHDYYAQLAKKEQGIFRKMYFRIESLLLKRYEHNLGNAQAFFSLSKEDSNYFKKLYPVANNLFVPPFHSENEVTTLPGIGDFCLYQGNLSHPENIEALQFLLADVIPQSALPVIIAGRNPSPELLQLSMQTPNCRLVVNPTESEMNELVTNAHIHLLPTFQRSGVKLKLIKALFRGRHVVFNENMLFGTGLNLTETIANTGNDFVSAIQALSTVPFTGADIEQRKQVLSAYSNGQNAQLLLEYIP